MGAFIQDIKYSLRLWGRNPGFALVVVLTLALGIGANTAIFSVVNGVLLRPLPYDGPEKVVRIWRQIPQLGDQISVVTSTDYEAWKEGSQMLEGAAAYTAREFDVSLGEDTASEKILGAQATHDLFEVLGVLPLIGRPFTEEDAETDDPVVLISYSLWRSRFSGDEGTLGQTLRIDSKPYTVIGVMPHGFQFPLQGEFWTPRKFASVIQTRIPAAEAERGGRGCTSLLPCSAWSVECAPGRT